MVRIHTKHQQLRERLNQVIQRPREPVPDKYINHFKHQLHEIKTKHYDYPSRAPEVVRNDDTVVLDLHDLDDFSDPLEDLPGLGRYDENEQIAQLNKQLAQKDQERIELIEEFQIKHTDFIQQLNKQQTRLQHQQRQLDEYARKQQEYIDRIRQLEQENHQLKKFNDEYDQFRTKSINKMIELKLKNKANEERIDQLISIKNYLQLQPRPVSKSFTGINYNDLNTTRLIFGLPQNTSTSEDDTMALINGNSQYKSTPKKSLKSYIIAVMFVVRLKRYYERKKQSPQGIN